MITAQESLRIESDVVDTVVSLFVKGVLGVLTVRDKDRNMQGLILPKRTKVGRELQQGVERISKAVVMKKRVWTE